MAVLLDESVPRALGRALSSHHVSTVSQMGWAGIDNGELLRRAADAGFRALVTADRNMEYQQNLAAAGVGVVVLIARSTRVGDILPLAPAVDEVLLSLEPGAIVHVGKA